MSEKVFKDGVVDALIGRWRRRVELRVLSDSFTPPLRHAWAKKRGEPCARGVASGRCSEKLSGADVRC
jgi:hypothetical protein